MSRKVVITHAEGRWCTQQSFNGKRQAPVIRERSRRPRLAVKPSRQDWASRISLGVALCIGLIGRSLPAADVPAPLSMLLKNNCLDCHDGAAAEGGLDLASLAFTLGDRGLRDRWILIHDRIHAGEMPPDPQELSDPDRQTLLKTLNDAIVKADRADVIANGRGPLRRLTREEYEQNLRDVLQLPLLDIRDMLPEDREAHRFNKTAAAWGTPTPTTTRTCRSFLPVAVSSTVSTSPSGAITTNRCATSMSRCFSTSVSKQTRSAAALAH